MLAIAGDILNLTLTIGETVKSLHTMALNDKDEKHSQVDENG